MNLGSGSEALGEESSEDNDRGNGGLHGIRSVVVEIVRLENISKYFWFEQSPQVHSEFIRSFRDKNTSVFLVLEMLNCRFHH